MLSTFFIYFIITCIDSIPEKEEIISTQFRLKKILMLSTFFIHFIITYIGSIPEKEEITVNHI